MGDSLWVDDTDFIGIVLKSGSVVIQGIEHDEVEVLSLELLFGMFLFVRCLERKTD